MEPDMDHPCGSACITEAHEMLKKARKHKNGNKNILDRWNQDKYRKSLSDIEWIEVSIIQHDEIALDDHYCTATREEVGTRNHGNDH